MLAWSLLDLLLVPTAHRSGITRFRLRASTDQLGLGDGELVHSLRVRNTVSDITSAHCDLHDKAGQVVRFYPSDHDRRPALYILRR